MYAVNFAVLAAWSTREFDRYAAATGATVWCVALAQTGPEKVALTLLPRTRRSRQAMIGGLLASTRLVTVLSGAVALTAILVDASSTATLYVAVAVQSVALGLNVAAVALQRALGRPQRDVVNFALLSAGWILLAGLTFVGRLDPLPYVMGRFVVALLATELASRNTSGSFRAFLRARSVQRLLGRTVLLLAFYDIGRILATSSVFVVLAFTAFARQSGELYLVVAGVAVLNAAVVLVLRVYQPQTTLRLAAAGAATGRRVAGGYLSLAVIGNALWLVAAGTTILALDLRSVTSGGALSTWLVLSLGSQLPFFVPLAVGIYLLENSDTRSLRTAAASAVAGLVGTTFLAILVVPHFGAIGAVWALTAGELIQAVYALRQVGPGDRRLRLTEPALASGGLDIDQHP